jgi:CubicO group peptidase (beta-lactamase class C family)
MRITITTLGAVGVLVGAAHAQTTAPDRFKHFDKNGDGKLSQDEFPYPYFYKQHDKDGDGLLSPEEAAQIKPLGKTAPELPGAPPTPITPATAADFKPRPHGEEATKASLNPEVLAKLDIAMQQAVANKEVSGVIGLIHHNGERGYFEAFGWQDIEAQKPLSKDALFRLQSMSKPVVSACAMALFDAGLFTLDEPISKHCPEWAEPKVKEGGAVVPAKAAITPRMLMSHSSGLGYGGGQAAAAMAYQAMMKPGATLKEFSEAVAKEPLMFQPGTNYNYGMGLDILGRYLEAITGQPLDVILRERLFGPLKMTDTDFHVPVANVGRLCQIYGQPSPGVLVPGNDLANVTTKPTLCLGGHGLFGTIGDYERLCLMILNRGELDGVRVLKPETVDLIFENHLKHPTMKYGLGGIVNGAGSYGWGGADGTQFVVDRSKRTFTLFMVQTQHYKAPTYPAFLALANEACGLTAPGAMTATPGGTSTVGGMSSPYAGLLKQRDLNGDGKLGSDEVPAALLQRLDSNQDGFVKVEELTALGRK